MSNEKAQASKGKMKYFPPQAYSKCTCCQEFSKELQSYKEIVEKSHNSILEILSEQKVLMDRILTQNATVDNIMKIFPINSDETLKEFDAILGTHGDPYIRQMKTLIAGNAERNLHHIFGSGVIMSYNVDGTFGKKSLRDFKNVLAALIDVISTFNDAPDKTLRVAFQRQKKKYFKQAGRTKNKTQAENEISEIINNETN